jgi:hypothetical protein
MTAADLSEFKLLPRPTVEIRLPDERVICVFIGAPVGKFLSLLNTPDSLLECCHQWRARELLPHPHRLRVIPISMEDPDGMLIYRRS